MACSKGLAVERNGMTRVVIVALVAWFLFHVGLYIDCACQIDPAQIQGTWCEFFGCQAAGFLAVALVAWIGRPTWVGLALGGYLILSTLALLGFSQDPVLIAKFFLLLLWGACAIRGLRQR